MAASAAVPGLIGPVVYRPGWGSAKTLHLWDGGVYDNAGMEVLFKPTGGFQKDIDRLYVSDGGAKIGWAEKKLFRSWLRLVDIPRSQVRGLRSRIFIKHLIDNPKSGGYLQIGNTVGYIFKKAGLQADDSHVPGSMHASDVKDVAEFPTTLRKVSDDEFNSIMRHGYEVCNATFHGYLDGDYK